MLKPHESDDAQLEVWAHAVLGRRDPSSWRFRTQGGELAGLLAHTASERSIDDLPERLDRPPRVADLEVLASHGYCSFHAFAIADRGRGVGVLVFASPAPRALAGPEQSFAQRLAVMLAIVEAVTA